ncbi:hypothetical protein AKJ16_DCAP06224, partial [Drosera capensis]
FKQSHKNTIPNQHLFLISHHVYIIPNSHHHQNFLYASLLLLFFCQALISWLNIPSSSSPSSNMKETIKWGSSACAPTAITLLVLSMVLSVGFVSAVPASRSMNFVVQAPSIIDLCAQGMMDMWVCSKKI